MKFLTSKKGFTLIELLVVVTLIAILAVAVLATINPIEQRRKAQDTAIKSLAADVVSAQERYFAVYGCYTWNDATTTFGTCTTTATVSGTDVKSTASPNLQLGNLVTAGEAKANLTERVNALAAGTILLTVDGSNVLHAAFAPTSKAFKQSADCSNTCSGCNDNAPPASGTAYWCAPDSLDN